MKNLYGKIMILSGNTKEFIWTKIGKVKNLYRNVKDLFKKIWKNDEFDWPSERICMAKIWKSEEIVWKREGIIKKSEEFLWKNYEFVSWKVKEFIWPNDILCDVNCILSKCFQVQFWGCPGKPKLSKISIPYSMWVE